MDHGFGQAVQTTLDLLGLYAFATSGALMAIRKRFDAVGIMVLAVITALGGGIVRDLIIGATPPAAFVETSYLVIPLAAAGVTFFAHPVVEKLNTAILIFDAVGLGLYTVTGTLKALDHGLGLLQSVILGVLTGVGGGVLRDLLAMETPALLKVDTELYAIPAAAGGAVVVTAAHFGWPLVPFSIGGAVFIFLFRVLAMVRRWHAPAAWERRRATPPPG